MTDSSPSEETRPDADEPTADAQHLLAVYLQDHHAAAAAGLALVRRCFESNVGTEFEHELGGLVASIASDADRLTDAMSALGVEPSRVKILAARAGEVVGRLKSNGRLFDYSPTSRVLELEGLIAGITAKRQLWRSLSVAEQDALRRTDLDMMSARADEQIAIVDALHGRAAQIAFDPAAR